MEPCYIVTYYLRGECAVNVNSVVKTEETAHNRCMLHFKDGSTLELQEACEAYYLKKDVCTPDTRDTTPVFG